jgi:hypothetical protein
MHEQFNINEFVRQRAEHLIGENGIIGTSIIVFEFIDEDGDGGFSVLRPPGTDWSEAMSILHKASKVILESYERDRRMQDDDESEDY